MTEGETFTGTLQADGTILWNDGDVWRRVKTEEPAELTDADSLPVSPREIFASTPDSLLSGGGFTSRIEEEVSTPSPLLSGGSFASRIQAEMQSVGMAAGMAAPVHAEMENEDISESWCPSSTETENEDVSNLSLQFLEGGGFALQSSQDSAVTVDEPEPEPVRWAGSVAGGDSNGSMLFAQPLLPGQAVEGTVKVVNTFITILPSAQDTYSGSGRCRAQSEGLARPSV